MFGTHVHLIATRHLGITLVIALESLDPVDARTLIARGMLEAFQKELENLWAAAQLDPPPARQPLRNHELDNCTNLPETMRAHLGDDFARRVLALNSVFSPIATYCRDVIDNPYCGDLIENPPERPLRKDSDFLVRKAVRQMLDVMDRQVRSIASLLLAARLHVIATSQTQS